ncbi:MAG: Gldg family protein [Candidatus Acidiferrales bacterium]
MKKWKQREVAEFLASIGVAMLIAGYLRYTIQGELLLFSKITLIAGGILLVAGIVLGFKEILGFFSKRSSRLGTNTTVLALAVIAILGLVNFLGYRHHKRFDLTSEKLYTLSDQTRKIVSGLSQDVTIARFAKQPDRSFDDLMTEYRNLSPHLKVETVDPLEKPDVAKDFGATRLGDVILASGPVKLPIEPGPDGNFSEQDITSAILKATRNKVKMVCFVTGHGEKSLSDGQAGGYNLVDQGLKKEGYNTDSVNLVSSNGVPSECDVLVIAGPTRAFFPQEAAMVSKYLDAGGKALVEVDPQTDPKLGDIFSSWNISVGGNFVIDASGMGQLLGAGPAIPLVVDYGDSPITKKLQGTMTFFPLARTVSIADKSKTEPEAVEILKTSPRSFTIPKLEQKVKFDPKTDTAGPLSLGVAAGKKVDDQSARLVVIGNSAFASNQAVNQAGNGDLFYNSIDWLAQDENLISIRPKTVENRSITLTESQAALLKWLDLFILPGIVIFSGIVIWWKRR